MSHMLETYISFDELPDEDKSKLFLAQYYGGCIEHWSVTDKRWTVDHQPCWGSRFIYRIKPIEEPSASLYRELSETMGLKSGPVSWGSSKVGVYPIERDRLLQDCISNNAGSRIPFEDTVESMILILDRHCLQHEREINDLKTRLAALEGSKTNA